MQQTNKKNLRYNYIAINKIKKVSETKTIPKNKKVSETKTIPNYKRNIKMVASI